MHAPLKHDRRIHPGAGRRRGPRSPEGPAGRSRRARRGAGAARRARAPPRPADRVSASAAGPLRLPACAPSRGARRGDAAGAGRGLRGRLVLRAFRHRHGRRGAAAAADRAGLRQPDLRACPARRSCSPICAAGSATGCGSCARRAWAAATTRRSSRSATRCTSTRRSTASPPRSRRATRTRRSRPFVDLDAYRAAGGYACSKPASPASASREELIEIARGLGSARPGRRRVPDRAQMALRAAGAGAPADGGQCRRGRARHVQGPLFPRNRPASVSRRHADRRLGGRGGRGLHLSARRIPAMPRDPRKRDRRGRGGGAGAAHAHPSAARRRRLYLRRGIGDARKHRGQARPAAPASRRSRRRSGCSAGRP